MSTRALPQRSTRGKRLAAQLEDEEEAGADNEFWNQEFFAEEQVDVDFDVVAEGPAEDIVDSDFDDPEEDDDDDDEVVVVEKKKKTLRPPGYIAKPKPKPKAAAPIRAAKAVDDEDEEMKDVDDEDDDEEWSAPVIEAPSLRRSTKIRSEEAKMERKIKEASKPKRKSVGASDNWRPLTQQELLAEAARTEIDNIYSLKMLLAREEETKRRAQIVKKNFTGPSVKLRSFAKAGEGMTTMQVCNSTDLPEWMRPKAAPPKQRPETCFATGFDAKYRDPKSGQPYANAFAYQLIKASTDPLQPKTVNLDRPVPPNQLAPDLMSLVVDLHSTLANERRQMWMLQNQQPS